MVYNGCRFLPEIVPSDGPAKKMFLFTLWSLGGLWIDALMVSGEKLFDIDNHLHPDIHDWNIMLNVELRWA